MKTDKDILLQAHDEMRDIDRALLRLADLYRDRGVPGGREDAERVMARRYRLIKAIVRRMKYARSEIMSELDLQGARLGVKANG